MNKKKVRLDQLLVQRGLAETRGKAQALIMAGVVRVAGMPGAKAGEMIAPDAELEVVEALSYVSRGGHKLAHALDVFGLAPVGLVALDVGASTGGFTDVLLQRGAARVYAVDVGYGLLDWRLRQDPRVVVVERTNIRYLEALPNFPEPGPTTPSTLRLRSGQASLRAGDHRPPTTDDTGTGVQLNALPETLNSQLSTLNSQLNALPETLNSQLLTLNSQLADCATIDVAFISLRLVLPAVQRLIAPGAWIVALIKPQFEAGAEQVGKGGVVRDPAVHAAVLREVLTFATGNGLALHGLTRSPITGPAGNVEFLAWLGGAGPALDGERAIAELMKG